MSARRERKEGGGKEIAGRGERYGERRRNLGLCWRKQRCEGKRRGSCGTCPGGRKGDSGTIGPKGSRGRRARRKTLLKKGRAMRKDRREALQGNADAEGEPCARVRPVARRWEMTPQHGALEQGAGKRRCDAPLAAAGRACARPMRGAFSVLFRKRPLTASSKFRRTRQSADAFSRSPAFSQRAVLSGLFVRLVALQGTLRKARSAPRPVRSGPRFPGSTR